MGTWHKYGGAERARGITVAVSLNDIRQIPDHQEVFLSPTTLTSIIFEINDYVRPGATNPSPSPGPTTTTSTTTAPDGTTTTTTTTAASQTMVNGRPASTTQQPGQSELDAEAAKYHFTDVIAAPDTLASPLPNPQPVKMVDPSLADYPAYMLAGNINSLEMGPRSTSTSSSHHQQQPQQQSQQLTSLVHQLELLVRLQPYNADVCVRINVPVKEFVEAGQRIGSSSPASSPSSSASQAMIAQEVGHARDVFARIVGTLAVRDWRLFNA